MILIPIRVKIFKMIYGRINGLVKYISRQRINIKDVLKSLISLNVLNNIIDELYNLTNKFNLISLKNIVTIFIKTKAITFIISIINKLLSKVSILNKYALKGFKSLMGWKLLNVV